MAHAPGHDVDHYATLGIVSSASPEEIARAYRRLALQLHPDKGGGALPGAFQAVQDAYETLRDPVSRLIYDEARRQRASAPSSSHSTEMGSAPAAPGVHAAVGTCLAASATAFVCGLTAGLGALLCGVGARLLQQAKNGSGRGGNITAVAALLLAAGGLFLWGSPTAWVVGCYMATAMGLGFLAAEREQLPEFLPYLLFTGYLLLFLLAPALPSGRVVLELPGLTVVELGDTTLPECTVVFTWGIVVYRCCFPSSRSAAVGASAQSDRKAGLDAFDI